jgi:hypothetical protein
MLGGWQMSSIGLWHTGHPLTVQMDLSQSIDPLGNFGSSAFAGLPYSYFLPDGNDQTSQRPDLIPGVPVAVRGGGRNGMPLINAAAFQAPPQDANGNFLRYGDAPNGVVRALNNWQIDFALTKKTKLTERASLEFAVQAFNIFNHIQLGDPGSLNLVYAASRGHPASFLDTPGTFGIITSTVNFNNNNDNKASPNTGTGLPRQLQFMVRVRF